MYDVYEIKKEFPLLNKEINGKKIFYLDTSASAQKPRCVIDKMLQIYESEYANPHRGAYYLADRITSEYEAAREIVRQFINAESVKEIVFTRNATESINLVASSWGMANLKAGDEVVISEAEHHANLVPWQQICLKTGAKLQVFKVTDSGDFDEEDFTSKLSEKTKMLAISAMSNVLGSVFPVKEFCKKAKKYGALTLVDACQFAVHQKIDVADFDCDFLAFSGHKTYGPTGIGVLYGKENILRTLPAYQFGGDMVDSVSFERTTFADIPARFEAGTPASVQAIGLGEALKYMQKIGQDNILAHENELVKYALECFDELDGMKIIGTSKNRGGVFCFDYKGIHPADLSFVLNKENVFIRIGHHCAQPIVNRMGYSSLARASFGIYTAKEDVDELVGALKKAAKFFI
ncbi:MAG: SufS family cysteine desulfurase [Alphaproteobacteria bacterium]|nr:SufS family cysteine desulfurase [Alphaproteobacteria bacterium]